MRMECVRRQGPTGFALLVVCALPAVVGLSGQPKPEAIRAVLDSQQTAWNRGDVEAFMSGYDASDSTTFVGATITRGYRQVLENYHRRYPSKEKMGHLTFSEIEVTPLGAEFASVLGNCISIGLPKLAVKPADSSPC